MYKSLKNVTRSLYFVTLRHKTNTIEEFCYKLKSPGNVYFKENT